MMRIVPTEADRAEEAARDRWRKGVHRDVAGICPVCTEYFGVAWLCSAAKGTAS